MLTRKKTCITIVIFLVFYVVHMYIVHVVQNVLFVFRLYFNILLHVASLKPLNQNYFTISICS